MKQIYALIAAGALLAAAQPVQAQSLRGSRASLDLQVRMAADHDFTYLTSTSHMRRPEVVLFLERLGKQYREACGEPLVVTSLTRPKSRQPRNASPRSVHPTGMAVDLRRSWNRNCRGWLEAVLLHLEGQGVLEATREMRPPHYHVAVFPEPYARYVESRAAEVPPNTYRVQSGDSLSTIARRTGTTVAQLAAANGIRGSRIYAGQVLKVPVGR